jgi:hypothetical protein
MADNKSKRRPQDSSRINMNEDYEVSYWTRKLGVSREELKRATSKFGSIVARVRKGLKG